ncbi:hypothetical protein N9N67_05160 [Bacteriovoracaceae bacterium]|nr:hypothetical protein [Bacteriovoracaceae bacterium]
MTYLVSSFFLLICFSSYSTEILRVDHKTLMRKSSVSKEQEDSQKISLQFQENNLLKMEEKSLMNLSARKTFSWRGYSWPYLFGAASFRFLHPKFSSPSSSYSSNRNKFFKLTTEELINSGKIKDLSPAEKYDVLLGDKELTLSRAQWKLADTEVRGGSIPYWVGLCHGWSAASGSVSMPSKSVRAKSSWKDGLWVEFTPTDLSVLATLLWSHGQYLVDIIGDRCEGRKVKGPCGEDLEVADFHMALTNIIGLKKKFLVMDYSRNYVVNNMPILKYQYQYLDLKNKSKPVRAKLSDALSLKKQLARRSWRRGRHSKVKYVVGIKTIIYAHQEKVPGTVLTSNFMEKNFIYDLELDSNFKIIGGRWHTSNIPDFVWYPSPGETATSLNDRRIKGLYRADEAPSSEFTQYASGFTTENGIKVKGSSEFGQPLKPLIDQLLKLSR